MYEGQARFESAHEVSVGPERLTAPQIFINVGGRAVVPAMPGIEQVPYLTNSSMMDVDFLPRHLVIVGGSYIGLEFGQMFRRFGSEVTIIEMASRLISREDEDVSATVREILEAEGVHIRLNAKCIARLQARRATLPWAWTAPPGCRRSWARTCCWPWGGVPTPTTWVWRKPASRWTSAATSWWTTSCAPASPGIWALGDCNGRGAFTHTSYNDYEIVAANLLDGDPRRVSDRIQAYALYIDPPLGRCGMTEAQVRQLRPAGAGRRSAP